MQTKPTLWCSFEICWQNPILGIVSAGLPVDKGGCMTSVLRLKGSKTTFHDKAIIQWKNTQINILYIYINFRFLCTCSILLLLSEMNSMCSNFGTVFHVETNSKLRVRVAALHSFCLLLTLKLTNWKSVEQLYSGTVCLLCDMSGYTHSWFD